MIKGKFHTTSNLSSLTCSALLILSMLVVWVCYSSIIWMLAIVEMEIFGTTWLSLAVFLTVFGIYPMYFFVNRIVTVYRMTGGSLLLYRIYRGTLGSHADSILFGDDLAREPFDLEVPSTKSLVDQRAQMSMLRATRQQLASQGTQTELDEVEFSAGCCGCVGS
jgi:hypothetical protein